MEIVEELPKELAYDQVKKLLVDLAIHFSNKTKFVSVPNGTIDWACLVSSSKDDSSYPNLLKEVRIRLIPFFGTYAGYNSELDLLVMWKE